MATKLSGYLRVLAAIEEHYTDTHGYTEPNFAAFAMLGLRFCPRIRGVQHQRIYRIDSNRDYGPLTPLVGRADRPIDTELIAEQWDRWASFTHRLRRVTSRRQWPSNGRWPSAPRNCFYRANRELGRILGSE